MDGALENRVLRLHAMIADYHRAYGGSSIAGLTLGMLSLTERDVAKKYPRLKAKAAETCHLGPALLHIWEARADHGKAIQAK
eukprot:3968810-Alexandrium_andersonii.AAC.1